LVVSPDAGADAPFVTPLGALARGAGVVACVGVDAGLEAEAVDVIDQRAQSVGEFLGMEQQVSVHAVASAEIAVVDVDVLVSGFLQAAARHGVGLFADELLADVDAVGVPRAPAHGGGEVLVGLGSRPVARAHGEQAGD